MNQFTGQGIRGQRGIVLIIAMLVMAILSILGLAFLMTAQTEEAIAANYRNHTAAFYAAEAGVESGVASLKSLVGANPTPTDAQLASLLPPALTDPNYSFSAFQVRRVRTVAPYSYKTTLTTGAYAGLMAWTTDYDVTATVTGPRASAARVTQKIQHVGIPLFQFMGFYGRGVDLELAPGPAMTITGRIHSNSNLYLKSGNGLKIDSYVTTTGNIYRYVKGYGMSDRGVSPQIKDANGVYQTLNFDHEYNYNFANTWSESDWKSAALSAFGDRVQD
ncbi:MAG: PilX N-terminal domain-containing pilus assembly protein, partial [Candidatus Methylomirabilales bacterium]